MDDRDSKVLEKGEGERGLILTNGQSTTVPWSTVPWKGNYYLPTIGIQVNTLINLRQRK